MKQSLAVIFGGVSSEHEISLLSSFSILSHLDREKYDVHMLGITTVSYTHLDVYKRQLQSSAPMSRQRSSRSSPTQSSTKEKGSRFTTARSTLETAFATGTNTRSASCLLYTSRCV